MGQYSLLRIPYVKNMYIDSNDSVWANDQYTRGLVCRNDLKIITENGIYLDVLFTFRVSKKRVEFTWLKHLAVYKVSLPAGFEERIFDIDFIKCSKITSSFEVMMIFKKPILFDLHYFIIPGLCKYAINMEGDVIDCESKKLLKIKHQGFYQYPSITIKHPYKDIITTAQIHRLMALTFIENPFPIEKPYVNHKNGNKQDYRLENLEWCSSTENNLHAVNTGLRLDNVSVKVKDYKNNTITVYGSLRQASDKLETTLRFEKNDISTLEKPKLISNRYEIKDIADMSPWNFEIKKSQSSHRFKLIIRDGDKEIICYGVKDFVDRFNLRNEHLVLKDWVDEFKQKYPKLSLEIINNSSQGPYMAYNVDTKEKYVGDKAEDIAKKIDASKSAVIKYLSTPKALIKNIWHVQSANEPLEDNLEYKKSNNQPSKIECIKNNEKITCQSLRECSRVLGIDKKTVKKHIECGKTINGYSLKYVA